jgi:hypothetical protein
MMVVVMIMKVKIFFIEAAFMCAMNNAQNMNANGEVRPPLCFTYSADFNFSYGLAFALNVAGEDRTCHCFTDRRDIFRKPIALELSSVQPMRMTEQ